MKEDMEYCRLRLNALYQRQKRLLITAEGKSFRIPTKELELEVFELRGILKGVAKAIALFEKRANDNMLPGLGLVEGEKHGPS